MNILFFACDDACHINGQLKQLITGFSLPNLEALMASGTNFERAYCTVPICEPARAAVMTGLSPAATKAFDFQGGWKTYIRPEQIWPYRLKEAGYHMVTQGKIFHGNGPRPGPQPQWVYDILYDDVRYDFHQAQYAPDESLSTVMPGYSNAVGTPRSWPNEVENMLYDYRLADRAINFLNTYSGSKPFYCEVGFYRPHDPHEAPQWCFDAIPLENVHIDDVWMQTWEGSEYADKFVRQFGGGPGNGLDPTQWTESQKLELRQAIRNYAAGYTFMDYNLGRVLDAHAASPFANNTMVTFFSDHGYHTGSRSRWHKFTLYEQAARAPLVIKVPGQTPQVVNTPVSHIDLGATILDYAGIQVDSGFRGVSLRPFIEGQPGATHDPVPTFWYGSFSMIDSDLKRTTIYNDGSYEMYDIANDPWGFDNIADSDPDFNAKRDLAIETAYDWGYLLVENAIDTSRPSLFQSLIGTEPTEVPISTSFAALGDLHELGRNPHYNMMYRHAMTPGEVMRMPAHVRDFRRYGVTTPISSFSIIANDEKNSITMGGSWAGEVYLGGGDDTLTSNANGQMTVYGMDGNDLLQVTGGSKKTVYGGSGNDTIIGGGTGDELYGGTGDDDIQGRDGADTIYGGAGNDTMHGGAGNDIIHLDGGADTAIGGGGSNTFVVYRRGGVNTINDLTSSDTIDLSDWAAIQPVSVVQSGSDVVVSAALERLVCLNTTAALVSGRITGATVS